MIEEPLEDVERPPAAVGIVEAGSTITKSYIASESGVASRALVGINFKENYRKTRHFSDDDLELLAGCARELLTEVSTVRVYGTSIFRDVEQGELVPISERLARLGDVTFEVVTSSQEALLTAEGAIDRLDFDGDIAVMVGGGGSTEVAVFRHGSLMGLANTSMGVGDVNAHFPDLTDDLASSQVEEVVLWISRHLAPHDMSAELLVLAGGDFPLLYANAGYPLQSNPHSSDPEKRYLLTVADKRSRDEALFHELRLSSFSHLTPDAPKWWDGTRAMCCVVSAVARQLNSRLLVPTRVSMVYGIAHRLLA